MGVSIRIVWAGKGLELGLRLGIRFVAFVYIPPRCAGTHAGNTILHVFILCAI